MNNGDAISTILIAVLAVMLFILVVLVIVLFVLKLKDNQKKKRPVEKETSEKKEKPKNQKSVRAIEYTKESIFDFMEFDSVEDNMIVHKKGRRFIMVIECQGVNYDLMSGVEKVSVEEGFQQFLNTLRHPIQIYIQTRTINLEKSLQTYKQRVKEIEDNYRKKNFDYNRMTAEGVYTREQLEAALFDLTKEKNLLEYARDVVNNTEKMSLNRNILSKKYYVVIPFVPEESGNENYGEEELRNIAFSELYTKAQAIIRTLSGCSVSGKILTSKELIELLYVAYNRDDSEIYGIDTALRAGLEDLYSTAPDVFERKMKVLDQQIQDGAIDLANEAIQRVKSKAQKAAEEKEKNVDELMSKMAQLILEENKAYVGAEIANGAIEELQQEAEAKKEQGKGGKENEKEQKTTRGRKKSTAK